ncbi:MAG: GDP-mannose 4,6-dehydratase [Nanoarchaeota archaeon]|nr:GDP-mannose 4,6-dehydratase [Nanoarchaeota archaeon]
MKRKALITGITGQDGSYLAELLIEKGYEVHGMVRRASTFNTSRIDHLCQEPPEGERSLVLHYGDLVDSNSITKIVNEVLPDEVYNLGAQSHVRVSFDNPEYTVNTTGMGSLRVLEAVKNLKENFGKEAKVYQASSSEMFGSSPPLQNENTPFHPRSPYGSAKVFAFHNAVNYREAHHLFVSNGILFNHESPRRGETFVTRKVTMSIARIIEGLEDKLYLGNLESKRDWGYAPEYVEAAWMMLQQEESDDFVIGTGEGHSVQEFVELAFDLAELKWEDHVEIDPHYYRPTEVDALLADTTKAREKLGWEPKTKFNELVKIMVDADLKRIQENGNGR